MYLIALMVVFALLGIFAAQNDGTQTFRLLGYTWTLQTWAPAAIGTGIVSILLLLHMSHAGIGYRVRQMGHGRALDEHRDMIDELRSENGRLREELAAAHGEVRGATSAAPRRGLLDGVRSLGSRDRTTTA
jgi:hypothetical protein